jgi:hypothetical protein
MSHGGLKRARSWKRRIQPKEAYSSSGLLYSEMGNLGVVPMDTTKSDNIHAFQVQWDKRKNRSAGGPTGAECEAKKPARWIQGPD